MNMNMQDGKTSLTNSSEFICFIDVLPPQAALLSASGAAALSVCWSLRNRAAVRANSAAAGHALRALRALHAAPDGPEAMYNQVLLV